MNHTLAQTDHEMAVIVEEELRRQQQTLVMIPSENYASKAVLQTTGTVFTNKYAEGYPGARYYNGCELCDRAEQLAIDRAKALFRCDHVNVQLHTGSQANMAAYFALCDPGDTILGMKLEHGGHLTHGKSINFSGTYYHFAHYGLDPQTDRIEYDEVLEIARECRPKLIVVGASAYPRILDFQRFKDIADEVGALLMADIAHIVGLIIAGCHPDPVPYCDVVTSTTHKTLRGPRGALILCKQQWADKLDAAVFPGCQAGPLMHIIAAKAVAFKEAQSFGFREYQRQIIRNAQALAKSLQEEGFRLVTGGTDNHLMLVDLREEGISGKEAADLLEQANIIVNKNTVPGDERPAWETSGIRPGTPALTTREMGEEQMQLIGKLMARVIRSGDDMFAINEVKDQVLALCEQFPIYVDLYD